VNPEACPSDDMIARFAHGLLSREQAVSIEAHIDRCRDCSALVVTLGKLGATDALAAPGGVPTTDAELVSARPALPSRGPLVSAPEPAGDLSALGSSRTMRPGTQGVRLLALVVTAELALALAHTVWSAMSLPSLARAELYRAAAGSGAIGAFALFAAAAYVVIWAPVGGLCALAAAWGVHRRRTWGRRLALAHAALSLLSPVLLPLAAYVVYAITRPAVRACWLPQSQH
jgi:hypothetical protein